jgi:hypothetical protein
VVARLSIIALLAACVSFVRCGGYYFVGFVSNPGGTTTITGMIITVSGGFLSDPTGITPFTAVTFATAGTAITVHFCGNQQELFSINKTVRADYTAGPLPRVNHFWLCEQCAPAMTITVDQDGHVHVESLNCTRPAA